jgi:putative toxin-antitoxin system antitoxin component (TIGR02293 family)
MDAILARAIEILGDERKAMHWPTTPNRALEGAVPMTLLDTPQGTEDVLTILVRIEYGVYI